MVALSSKNYNAGYAVVPEYTGIRNGKCLLRYIQSLHEYQKNEELRKQRIELCLQHNQ